MPNVRLYHSYKYFCHSCPLPLPLLRTHTSRVLARLGLQWLKSRAEPGINTLRHCQRQHLTLPTRLRNCPASLHALHLLHEA